MLSRSNPILHTSRLYSLFADGYTKWDHVPLFYEDWTDHASELLIVMDNEVSAIHKAIFGDQIKETTILEHYGVHDATSLTHKLRNIKAFKGIKAPTFHAPSGWVPDIASRYFVEDIGIGLKHIYELACQNKVSTLLIPKVLNWGLTFAKQ